MTHITSSDHRLISYLEREAKALGFDAIAVTGAEADPALKERLSTWLQSGHQGTMHWMEETLTRRADPTTLWADARSVIMLAMNYGPDHDPLDDLCDKDKAAISVYARNRDYHDVIKGKLKQLASKLVARLKDREPGVEVKVFVDTAPVMEKPLAQKAGLGWQGKHTNLVSRDLGSWFFLGSIFTNIALPVAASETDHCGSCRACLEICPTKAFPAPYQIDARRCISYLTIENKGPIPTEFRKAMGNRIYGCDDCLAACPWNKFAQSASEAKLMAPKDWENPALDALLQLDDGAFRSYFSGSPVKRIGRNRFIRNCLIAAGNSGNTALVPVAEGLLQDEDPLVRGAAVWALGELVAEAGIVYRDRMSHEDHPIVQAEWQSLEQANRKETRQ